MLRVSAGLALILALAFAGVAQAEIVYSQTGNYGPVHFFDDSGFPGGKCGYSAPIQSITYLRWMQLLGPSVKAVDSTGGVDSQKVTWQFKLLSEVGMQPWKTIATSSRTLTARDNQWTQFDPLKIYWKGQNLKSYRAVSVVKWYRNGNIDGVVKAEIEYYGVKSSAVSSSYVANGACPGTLA